MDVRPPLKIEVIKVVGFLKRHKVARPDELSPSFFNDGCELLTSELTELLELICAWEQTANGWYEWLVMDPCVKIVYGSV